MSINGLIIENMDLSQILAVQILEIPVKKAQNRKFSKQLPDPNRLFWVASLTNKLTAQK